ncbi:LacI family DNA-binding transcriptional regulator [Agromyces aerolatus]|uniref:LacI family DNA-binding transcriptional regulator n=1 Tax=Agromyces sp. LY-1074 TaxID=3074080 RepID=UPI00286647D2|nr:MULTISPECIES: LacI family DNA-binding transcriptional regulator [unclassified Agromyces]MDR5699521.1 LacI family DNA-binding transcriptional regulator [Agromyces sp. LY-1074]MDR5705817.1 LacI family DNA-binding transcriptional regulator [Agromyces sp. LY-1358]
MSEARVDAPGGPDGSPEVSPVEPPGSAGVPTMFDVARRAGVSHQTVSRVLNGLTGVAAATKVRVEQAIAELGYTPSPAARAMAKRRSGSIGLIQAGRPDYGPSSAALGFNEAARDAGYTVSQASMRTLDAVALRQAVHRLVLQRVEAIVLIAGEREASEVLRGIEAGVPLVAVASEGAGGPRGAATGATGVTGARRVHRVSLDQYAGARLATEHLIGLGHRRIAHVTGPSDSMDAAERRRGWTDVMREHSLELRAPFAGEWLAASGYEVGRSLLAEGWATAVFVGNDQMSLGLLHACHEAGVAVPDALSIVGFDDIPEAAYFTPALTTVRQDFDWLGRDVMATVLDAMRDDAHAPDRTARVPDLVVRASTTPPPSPVE